MKHSWILAIGLGALALLVFTGNTHAAQRRMSVVTDADNSGLTKIRYYRKRRPLEVNIYAGRRRVGGYSYHTTDVTNTYSRSPPPYADVRQTPAGPFDSGFFFDSGTRGEKIATLERWRKALQNGVIAAREVDQRRVLAEIDEARGRLSMQLSAPESSRRDASPVATALV
jgi:hypothetical protein